MEKHLRIKNNPIDIIFKILEKHYPDYSNAVSWISLEMLENSVYSIEIDDNDKFIIAINPYDINGNGLSIEDITEVIVRVFSTIMTGDTSGDEYKKKYDEIRDFYDDYTANFYKNNMDEESFDTEGIM